MDFRFFYISDTAMQGVAKMARKPFVLNLGIDVYFFSNESTPDH
jgi:hypothetical protein